MTKQEIKKMEENDNCKHKWEKWTIYDDEPGVVGGNLYQRRKCKKCGFLQINKQSY